MQKAELVLKFALCFNDRLILAFLNGYSKSLANAKSISLDFFPKPELRLQNKERTCPLPYTSSPNSSSHMQTPAVLGQVFMGKERSSSKAGVRIREQSAYKSSETIKPFPSFSLMRPSSKLGSACKLFPIMRAR